MYYQALLIIKLVNFLREINQFTENNAENPSHRRAETKFIQDDGHFLTFPFHSPSVLHYSVSTQPLAFELASLSPAFLECFLKILFFSMS